MVSLDATWASHREIHVLVVPVSPISSALFERCWTSVQDICSGFIPLKSLTPPSLWRDWANKGRGDSAFENFSWTSGTLSCVAVRHSMPSRGCLGPWVEHEPHRRIRAVIGFQACSSGDSSGDIMFDAEDIATKFATKEHDADLMRLSSAGVYMDPNDMPHILNNGALQLTTLDATIKSVIVNACLALHADAAALAVERLVSPGRDSFFSATTFARNGFTANLTPPSAGKLCVHHAFSVSNNNFYRQPFALYIGLSVTGT